MLPKKTCEFIEQKLMGSAAVSFHGRDNIPFPGLHGTYPFYSPGVPDPAVHRIPGKTPSH